MALKTFRPLTPASRFKALPSFDEITKNKKPEKSLLSTRNRTGGRNNQGRITCRHIGGGHKRKLRLIDFKRRKHGITAEVVAIEYDPNRTARIALLQYPDGEKAYILAPDGLKAGMQVVSGPEAGPQLGNSLPLANIPPGSVIHNIELTPGRGGQIARSAGQQAVLSNFETVYALVKMPSGEIRTLNGKC